ncbi:NPCBM/NEW2 domain-containing protein [Alienimonas californiensis]|uniref:NPCBM/NEW2 domain protein n=1 Tax=Alienimonas californiensis TaxID=2527989 RepID=A0A517PD64_9PLAN|nr:NPCBM/NEW2 domain-containing protein [Alienimonas californiensis]QDT17312.1 NPCBM/NEW2 domain protein [Alienimonas californiensis]
MRPLPILAPLLVAVALAPAAAPTAAAAVEAEVEAALLDGPSVTGALIGLADERLRLSTADGERELPFADLAELRFAPPETAPPAPESAVRLVDGSTLPVSTVTLSDGRLNADVPGLDAMSLPGQSVRAIRFRPLAGADAERWEELATSNPDGDLVVVRRGERLDKLDGSVGGVGAETVSFLLNGSEVPLPRGRANFIGIVFGRAAAESKPTAVVRPHVGGALRASKLALTDDGSLEITLTGGGTLTAPLTGVASIDFAAGSVTPLADLPTRAPSETTAGWADEPWPVGRNRNLEGEPIRIAGRPFDRGLTLHAPAALEWRLPKDTARLRAVAGIEDARRALGVGEVDLTIAGDGRELFTRRLTHTDDPLELDVDVTGVRVLTITVGVGDDPFAGDHLALGNARLTQ